MSQTWGAPAGRQPGEEPKAGVGVPGPTLAPRMGEPSWAWALRAIETRRVSNHELGHLLRALELGLEPYPWVHVSEDRGGLCGGEGASLPYRAPDFGPLVASRLRQPNGREELHKQLEVCLAGPALERAAAAGIDNRLWDAVSDSEALTIAAALLDDPAQARGVCQSIYTRLRDAWRVPEVLAAIEPVADLLMSRGRMTGAELRDLLAPALGHRFGAIPLVPLNDEKTRK